MDQLSRLQKKISDLVNILSIITKSGLDFVENDGDPKTPVLNIDDGELVDELDFEAPVNTRDSEADAIKRGTLDRLAEVLAKVKTAKKRDKRNLAAKHVTSVIMVEQPEASVVFLCAKNEGLDRDDVVFVKALEELLSTSDDSTEARSDRIDRVFGAVYTYSEARVKYCCKTLRNAFAEAREAAIPRKLTAQNVRAGLQQAISIDWEDDHGLRFKFGQDRAGEESVSDQAVDCLSDQDEETLVQETHDQIGRCFDNSKDPVTQEGIRDLLQKVYCIVRHPRQRPALKGLLRQRLCDSKRLFLSAWASLLYLTRIYFAAVTIVDFATKLNYRSIEFRPIAPPEPYHSSKSDTKTPSEALASLGCSIGTQAWRELFQDPEKILDFRGLSKKKKAVHAEAQLIFHVDGLVGTRERAFPYIGCSKKCCFFCQVFRLQHGGFQARGTHHTLFGLWTIPQRLPVQSLKLLQTFIDELRAFLQRILALPTPPPPRVLLQQSSAALSTLQAVRREAPTYSTRPQTLNKLMLGFGGVTATDSQMEFLPVLEDPGYATLMGGPERRETLRIPIEEAEMTKINHERTIASLESIHEMPPSKYSDLKLCRRCRSPARHRCPACWTLYCSVACQKRHWPSHVFACRVVKRPNDADYLKLAIRSFTKQTKSADRERLPRALRYLLADDHVCSTFGFNNCRSQLDIVNLVCIYSTVFSKISPSVNVVQRYLEDGSLTSLIQEVCHVERYVAQVTGKTECTCVTWFLECCSSESFLIPNRKQEHYAIWTTAAACAVEMLNLAPRFEDGCGLHLLEREVFDLYVTIQPNVWLLPDTFSSLWTTFGFCYCKSFRMQEELGLQYLALAQSSATFDDIVSAHETFSLADLMRTHGIGTSELNSQDIWPCSPSPCRHSVYRFMTAVEHALSGRYCNCFSVRQGRKCHSYFETHLDRESDLTYGFHLTSSWERWQLLSFYKYLFRLPAFDPICLGEAAEDPDLNSLENYLDGLVPGFRSKVSDRYRANMLFPRLKDRVTATTLSGQSIPHFHLPCSCKVHNVTGPPGLTYLEARDILRQLGS